MLAQSVLYIDKPIHSLQQWYYNDLQQSLHMTTTWCSVAGGRIKVAIAMHFDSELTVRSKIREAMLNLAAP